MFGVRRPPRVRIGTGAKVTHSRPIRPLDTPVLRSMQPHTFVSLLLVAVLPACSRASAAPHPEPRHDAVVVTPATPATAVVARDDIAGLFHAEAAQRDVHAGNPRIEDVLAAFKTAGVSVTNVRQHLAKPFGADYCAGADAGAGVVLSLCEYRTPAAAVAGRSSSQKGLASIPNRSVVVNGSTTLTLRERSATAESAKLTGVLERAFENVKK